MLLMQQKPTYSFKDTLTKPLLVYYDWKNDSLYSKTVSIDYAYTLNAHLTLVNNITITVSGVYSNEGPDAVLNGVKFMKNPHKWTHFFFRKYEPGPNLRQIRKTDTPMPEEWRDTYFVGGSNFSQSRVLSERNHLVMLFEENFESGGKIYYYDIGCVGFDMKTGELLWTQTIEKRQRDSGSGSFLSYLPIISKGRVWMVYLTERGAAGKLMCTSVYLASGKKVEKSLASNSDAQYLFFPESSGTVGGLMVLVGMGDPGRNDFKLISIAF